MLTRRQFIIDAGAALGAWLVGVEAAKRIIHLGRERKTPYLVEVEHPDAVLWANGGPADYRLTRSVPESEGYDFEEICGRCRRTGAWCSRLIGSRKTGRKRCDCNGTGAGCCNSRMV